MSPELLLNGFIYGFHDAINPCIFTTVVFFAFLLSQFERRAISTRKFGSVFIAVSFFALFSFSAGVLMNILYAPSFFKMAYMFYFIVGMAFVLAGTAHLYDWIAIKRSVDGRMIFPFKYDITPAVFKIPPVLIMFGAAVVLSALSTLWPANLYIVFYGSYLATPGKILETLAMLLVYNFMLTVPLIIFFWLRSSVFSRWIARSPSMVKIVIAAFLIALGGSLVDIFHTY